MMGNEWLGLTGLAKGLCKARRLHTLWNRMQARCNCPAHESGSDSLKGLCRCGGGGRVVRCQEERLIAVITATSGACR